MSTNPLLSDWLQHDGLPPFDQIQPMHFEPAFAHAFAAHNAELDAIANNTTDATFENTLVAYDATGRLLKRIDNCFSNLCSSETSPELQRVEQAMSPRLAGHRSAIYLHAALFLRIDSLYLRRSFLNLSPIQLRLLERIHLDFVLAGAKLDGEKRARFGQIVQTLATLQTTFSQRVLNDEASFVLPIADESRLRGLPQWLRDTGHETAQSRKLDAPYAFNCSRSVVEAVLAFAEDRALRKSMLAAFRARGTMNAEAATPAIITEILQLRQEQAAIMGHATFADYNTSDTMAGTPAGVRGLMDHIWPAAKARATAEYAQIAPIAKKDGIDEIEVHDWRYYAEKMRQQKFAIDDDEVKPYFALDKMTEAMFDCAGKLFGIDFEKLPAIPLYHQDVTRYAVRNIASGMLVGIFLTDNYARPSKRSGAWMSYFREQTRHHGGAVPIVVNTNNFPKPPAGQPTLMGFDDVRTMFHEFGHGLHGLLANSDYERLSGTNVLQDFVELPSQLFEHWATAPQVLRMHARHHVTGESIPDTLIEKLKKANVVNQGLEAVESTASVLVDQAVHALAHYAGFDAAAAEKKVLDEIAMPAHMKPRHELAHFGHLFSSQDYASRYYVYLWAEVLDADAFEAFEEAGDVFSPALGQKLHSHIYAAGNTVAPMETYRAFRGRDATVTPMLRKKGLI